MSRGLGYIQRSLIEILSSHEAMRPQQIARALYERHHHLGNAYASRYETVAIYKALASPATAKAGLRSGSA